MTKPTHLALVGSGLFVGSLILRWIFDRGNIRLHKILGSNFVLFSPEELDMVRALLDLGYSHCLKSWPRLGINDAEKRAFLHATSRSVKRAVTSNEASRMNVLKAPVAIQKPYTHIFDGDSRYDPFHWLRNDSRDDPEVLDYIKAENEYCQAVMADTVDLQDKLFKEMKGRIQEADCSVPVRVSGYYYYTRTLEGKQYGVHCRRKIPEQEDGEIVDEETTMDTSVPEEVLLDENVLALKHKYYSVCDVSLSENGKLLAYSEDTIGNELYSIRVLDLSTRKQLLSNPIGNTSGAIEWAADNNTFFYITQDDKQRPYRVWRTSLDGVSEPELVFEELDQRYTVSISKSTDRKLIWIASNAAMQNEMLYVPSASPTEPFKVVLPRVADVDYSVEHWHGHLFMVKRTSTTPNSEVYMCPLQDPTQQQLLRPHRDEVKIEELHVFKRHIALLERKNGLSECHVFTLPDPNSNTEVALENGDQLSFDEEVYVLRFAAQGDFESTVLSLYYSSLAKPGTWMAQNMITGNRVTRKITKVLGGFDQDAYVTARLWAPSHDGVKVPISLVYNKNLVEPKSIAHLHLDAYGAYEIINEPSFSRSRISLLDRGIVCAIAHVRGGGDLGRQWYETGKFLKKKNTFLDVIACAEHLIKEGWTSPSHMCLEGGSAGGMTVGAVANMRPELFQAIVAGVPFVDCLTTMLDDTIPLTTQEYEEWGNPNEKEYYEYMKSYSPLDNVTSQDYPHLLVTSGFHDPRVAYCGRSSSALTSAVSASTYVYSREPTKWVAKLRLHKTDNNILIHKMDMGAGHFSQSGRFDVLKEAAVEFAFILKCFGKHVDVGGATADV